MSKQVKISVKGLCLCFLDEFQPDFKVPIWNIVFACDERHELNFDFPPAGGPKPEPSPLKLHEPGKDLFIDFTGANTQTCDDDGTYNHLLNLADPDLHGVDASGKHCKLKIHRKSNSPTVDQIWMRVPHSILSVALPDETKNCWLLQIDENNLPIGLPKCKPPKAEKVSLEFSFENKIRVVVSDKHGNVSHDLEFSDANTELAFDNKCPVNEGFNDFADIYELVLDGPNEPGKRFISGKFAVPCLPFSEGDEETRSSVMETLLKDIRTPEANCDPIGIGPAPVGP